MSPDPRDVRVSYDKDGDAYLTDSNGEPVYDSSGDRVPGPPERTTSSGFTTYDTSRGHCSLCGRLTCNGSCFK